MYDENGLKTQTEIYRNCAYCSLKIEALPFGVFMCRNSYASMDGRMKCTRPSLFQNEQSSFFNLFVIHFHFNLQWFASKIGNLFFYDQKSYKLNKNKTNKTKRMKKIKRKKISNTLNTQDTKTVCISNTFQVERSLTTHDIRPKYCWTYVIRIYLDVIYYSFFIYIFLLQSSTVKSCIV